MNLFKLTLSFLAILSAQTTMAASNGMISFSGEVKDSTCQILSGDESKVVTLPIIPSSALSTSGDTAGATTFNLVFEGCNAGNVKAAFVPVDNVGNINGEHVKNTGTATNVDIALYQENGTSKINLSDVNAASDSVTVSGSEPAVVNLVAKYIATGEAGVGSVAGQVKYEIQYD